MGGISAITREKILALESAVKALPQIEIPTAHYFAQGLYAREVTIPAGSCVTGKIHLASHINIISKGDITVMTDEGMKRITAPATIISQPGIKRIGYAHEDTVWTTVHACGAETPEEAEMLLVVDTFEQFQLICDQKEQICHS